MMLIRILSPMGSPWVRRSRGIGVIYNIGERFSVPQVESGIYSRTNIFGASYKADVLQNNRPKNDWLLSVPFTTSYAIKICSNCWDKPFPDPSIRGFIELDGKTNMIFPSHLPLIALVNTSIHVF